MRIFPVQLTTRRIGNLTRFIHILDIYNDHTYIHAYWFFKDVSGSGFNFCVSSTSYPKEKVFDVVIDVGFGFIIIFVGYAIPYLFSIDRSPHPCWSLAFLWARLETQAKSTDGMFAWVVAAVEGLFIMIKAPAAKDTANILAYYSGSKSAYGVNVQAMCTADYRFCDISTIAPGSTNDWVA